MVNRPLVRFVLFVELRCLKLVQLSLLFKKPDKRFASTRVFCDPAGIRGIFDLLKIFLETFVPIFESRPDQIL